MRSLIDLAQRFAGVVSSLSTEPIALEGQSRPGAHLQKRSSRVFRDSLVAVQDARRAWSVSHRAPAQRLPVGQVPLVEAERSWLFGSTLRR